jgi:hypothetical protein
MVPGKAAFKSARSPNTPFGFQISVSKYPVNMSKAKELRGASGAVANIIEGPSGVTLRDFIGQPFDLVYVDSNHNYEYGEVDGERWQRK